MDCAKAIGARIARPNKSIAQMTGMFKVRKKLPNLYAVPTTASTGSETTVAAVITDTKIKRKFLINDLSLIPNYAILNTNLLLDLPPIMSAATGMDALTHAVEVYTNRYSSRESKDRAKKAVKLIFENLEYSFVDGKNASYRKNMLLGFFYAGQAFTKSYVGYVHIIAHGIGGLYHTPHGIANAVILPIVLQEYA